jgi:hypothetical protein
VTRLAVGLVLALCAARAQAVEWDSGDWKLDFTASVRQLLEVTRELDVRDLPIDPNLPIPLRSTLLDVTRLRLQVEARYGDHWSGQLAYDNEWYLGTGRESLAFRSAEALGSPTFLDLDQTIVDSADLTWRHLLYRGWVRYQSDWLEVVLGRQRIALGRAQLWNISDIFNPIPPLAVEADQRIGVDALLTRVKLFDELWGALIVAPQEHDQHPRSALRLELSERQVDGAVMLAKIDRDYVAGFDFSSNLGDAALRGELTETWHFHPEPLLPGNATAHGKATLQAVLSLDYTIPVGTGIYALIEHFYNQNVQSRDSLAGALASDAGFVALAQRLVPPPQFQTFSRNQTGFELGYDLTPILRGNVLWIHDWSGPSEAWVPSLVWSVRSDLDLTAGVQVYGGNDGSGEYGGRPPLYFVRADVYF